MFAAKTACEVSVLPRMIEMVVDVARAGVMAHPAFALIDVWGIGMAGAIIEVMIFMRGGRILDVVRTVGGDVFLAASDFGPAAMLR